MLDACLAWSLSDKRAIVQAWPVLRQQEQPEQLQVNRCFTVSGKVRGVLIPGHFRCLHPVRRLASRRFQVRNRLPSPDLVEPRLVLDLPQYPPPNAHPAGMEDGGRRSRLSPVPALPFEGLVPCLTPQLGEQAVQVPLER